MRLYFTELKFKLSTLFLYIFLMILLGSCSSKKDVIYLQNSDNFKSAISSYKDHIISPGDILKIKVNTALEETNIQFNGAMGQLTPNSSEILKLEGYNVSPNGYITFPYLGKIKLSGYNINSAEEIIYKALLDSNQLIDHNVSIRLLNKKFTFLGEVNKPGTYTFYDDNINFFTALGIAGDLTINGKRNDIKLIRNQDGISKIFKIDLTLSETLNSDFFQVKSGDVFIVNPNSTRVKNAGIIGNSGTLLSLLSFVLSSIIVINN